MTVMKLYGEEETRRVREMLKAISRTKLIADDVKEFGLLFGHKLGSNSLVKMLNTDFNVHAIFRELDYVIRQETNGRLQLEKFLEEYSNTSGIFMKKLNRFFKPTSQDYKQKTFALLDYIFFSVLATNPDRERQWDKVWETVMSNGGCLDIVLLMALRILPSYSGKGITVDDASRTMRDFLTEYVNREGCAMGERQAYTQTLIDKEFNIGGRLGAVAILYHFVLTGRMSFSPDLTRIVIGRANRIAMLDFNSNQDIPVVWKDKRDECCFWYFEKIYGAYNMVRCHYTRMEYTKYVLFLGSEFGNNIGRIIHPTHIHSLVNGRTTNNTFILAEWNVEKDNDGNAVELYMRNMPHFGHESEWIDTFSPLRLTRCRNQQFEKCFHKNSKGLWKLDHHFTNTFPDTEHIFVKSLYSISRDFIMVQDVRLTEEGHELIDGKYFEIPNKFVSDDLRLDDNIGIIIIGTKDAPQKQRKYIALDCYTMYFPIVDDSVIFNT